MLWPKDSDRVGAIDCECKSLKLLSKVFHHVISLQHVIDNSLDFFHDMERSCIDINCGVLTSGSPCTRTSRSSSSCNLITLAISSWMVLMYSFSEILSIVHKLVLLLAVPQIIRKKNCSWNNFHISYSYRKTYLFALYSRQTLRSSIVWGNDPLVVVGRIGRLSFFCYFSKWVDTGVVQWWSDSLSAVACNSK